MGDIYFQRMGVFLEAFDHESIEAICALLPVQKTQTRSGVPVAGFPVWEQAFLRTLTEAGHSVHIQKV